MILTVLLILALVAFGLVVAAAVTPKVPLWIGVLFLAIIALLERLPLRVFVLVIAAAALAACDETDVSAAITSYGPDLIGTAFAGLAAIVARFAITHVWLGGMMSRLVVEAKAAVLEVEQTYVDAITEGRADGTLTSEEAKAARAAAVAALRSNLGRKGLQRLGRILGLTDAEIDRLLGTHVEAAVKALSIAVPADKLKITVTDTATTVQPAGASNR